MVRACRRLGRADPRVSSVAEDLARIRQIKVVMVFPDAYWLYIDGVGTILLMVVDYSGLMQALLITRAVGAASPGRRGVLAYRRKGGREDGGGL